MYEVYMVKDGDTIESIAEKFMTTAEVIKNINNMEELMVNDVINVPKCCSKNFDYYVVSDGDTLYKIANTNGIEAKLLAQLNGLNIDDYIYPNQVLLIPRAGTILYFTAVGDTLAEIVKGLNADMEKILDQNNCIYLQPEQLIVYKYK